MALDSTEPALTEDGEGDGRARPRWVLGRWQIERLLGSGGMGEVYAARDPVRDQRVAVKILRLAQPGRLFQLKQEFRQLADLDHPNLVQLYELGVHDQSAAPQAQGWFLVMELVDGVHLSRAGDAWREEPDGVRLRGGLAQLAAAIQALHRAELLHLDLKPANILVEAGGRVVVLDFGLVHRIGDSLTSRGVGTPRYMAPEQLSGRPPSAASDWYAFGVMLFELLSGAPLFEGKREHIEEQQQALARRDLRGELGAAPDDLAALCCELLSPSPERRPSGPEILGRLGVTSPAPVHVAPIVGRDRELTALRDALARTTAGPSVCWVAGPSGIGKTALVDRFLAELSPEVLVLRGRCYEREAVPYKGFDSLMDDVVRQLLRAGPEARARLDAPEIRECTRLFPVLRHGGVAPSSADDTAPVELRRRAIDGLGRLLHALAGERRVVLFLDDLQWSDVDSARLWLSLQRRAWSVMMLGGYRADDRESCRFLQEIAGEHGGSLPGTEVSLAPLSPAAMDELSEGLLPQADPGLRARVCAESGGNPFLLQTLAHHSRSGELGEPSLERIVSRQLLELGDAAAALMKVVALAGRPIAMDIGLSAAGSWAPLATVTALQKASLVRSQIVDGVARIESYHGKIRDTVVELIQDGERVDLHARLARTLEASGTAEPESLGRHFHGAGELAKATAYTERAADDAVRALAFVRAAKLYEVALAWHPDPTRERREQLTRRCAQALFDGGRSIEAGDAFLRAAEHADHDRGSLERRAAEALMLGGDTERGRTVLASHLVAARVPPKRRAAIDGLTALAHLGWLLLRGTAFVAREDRVDPADGVGADLCWTLARGLSFVKPVDGLLYALRGLRLALALRDPTRVARVIAFLGGGVFHQIPGLRRVSRRYVDEAAALAERLASAELRGSVVVWKGMMELVSGDWDIAQRHIETAIAALAGRPGGAWERAVATGLQVWIHQHRGDLARSGALARDYLDDAVDRGDLYGQVLFKQHLAYATLAADRVAETRRATAWILNEWRQGEATVPAFYARWIEVCCDIYEGRVEQGHARWQAGRGDFVAMGGRLAAPARIDDTLLEARILLNEPATAVARRRLTRLAAQLTREQRQDCPPYASWLSTMVRSSTVAARVHDEALRQTALAFDRAGMALPALCIRLQGDHPDGPISARMRSLGVEEPDRWARAMFPAHRWA
jgi:hypothetical protein